MTESQAPAGGVRLSLQGELDIASAGPLRECLARLQRDRTPVTLDLSALEFMDSSGLSTVIEALMNSRRDGDQLTVAPQTSRQVARLVEVAGLAGIVWPMPGRRPSG